jgi:hypothetical protein
MMSTVTAKKRGRPKKAVNLEEEAILVENSPEQKPKKSAFRTQAVKDTKAPTTSFSVSPKVAEDASIFKSKVKRGGNGRNVAATKLVTNDSAKQKAPSSAGSAILQKAKAFTTSAEPIQQASYQAGRLNESYNLPIGSSINVYENENATVADVPRTIREQRPSITIKGQDQQIDAAGNIFGSRIEEVANASLNTSAATTVIEAEPARTFQNSDQDLAAPMSNGGSFPVPPGKGVPAINPFQNTSGTSSPPKSEREPTILPKISSKPSPRLPSSFTPPPPPPLPLRPTQLPYHELKKNPEFKALSRKYTSLIIAIPIALFTSYVLWGRCEFRLHVLGA